MALSPVDFYAYSRATGAPIPEDPEERAQMAPEVLEFRRNQLRAPQQESNPLATLGTAALGLGALLGAGFGARALMGRGRQIPKGPAKSATAGVRQVNLADIEQPVRRVKTEFVPAPSKAPPSTSATPQATVDLTKYVEVPFSDVAKPLGKQKTKEDFEVPAAEISAESFAENFVNDLVSIQQDTIPTVANNTFDALESGSDQLDSKLEAVVQRDVDSVRYSKPIVAVEKYTEVVNNLTPRQQRLMAELGQVGAAKTNLNDPTTLLKRASYEFEMNDWSDGPPEHLLDDLGNFLRQQEARNAPSTSFSLSGSRGDLPGVSEMSAQERKRFGKQIGLDLRPSKDREATGFFGADVDMSDFEGAVQGPSIGAYRSPEKTASSPVVSKTEIADRISAAANYTPGSYEHQLLLNPTVPTEKVRGLLGSTLRVEQGRVGRNLTHEITPGARASMTEVPGWKDEQAARRAQMTEEVVYDEYAGDTPYAQTVSWEDYEGATDLGEGEGPGGLTLSRTFDERTGKSRTDLPGQYQLAVGGSQSPRGVRPLNRTNEELYTRQERIDRVMPTRSTEEGDTSRGFRVNESTGRLTFEGASERDETGRLRPTDPTMMVEGDYEDRLVTKLVGGFQGVTGEPAKMVSTQPVAAYYEKDVVGKADPRLEMGSDGKLYVRSGQSEIIGEEPLVAFIGSRTTKPDGSKGPYTFLEKQGLRQIQLPIDTLTEIVEDAKDAYLNNPSVKKEFLARRNPDLIERGMKEGKLLSEIGDSISYNEFIIESLDKNLQTRGYKLPVLQPNKKGFYSKAAFDFISNVGQVTKESPVFGYPAMRGPNGGVIYQNTKYGKVPMVDKSSEPRPIPGLLDVRGTGGVDAMSVAEDYEGAVAYHSPRIESAPQVVRDFRTNQVLTATQAAQSPKGLLSTGETVPQLSPIKRSQFTNYPNVAMRTVKLPGGEGTYVATEFLPPVLYEVKVDPETGMRYPTTNIISQERTVERAPQVPNQSTAASLGTTGQKLVDLRRALETARTGYTAPYISNVGGGFIANTKRPFSSNAFYADGPVGGPLPLGGYVQAGEPYLTRFGYLNPNERGVGASRNLNLEMSPRLAAPRPSTGSESTGSENISTYDINQVMKQLQAQASRRRGSRRG
jgi:hypothetical protein